jgi:FAD/FMN-containing dehydrogenase
VIEYEPGDLTCVVEAGLHLSELGAVLSPFGQRLSLDPPGDPTVEECLLEDLSGPLRHRFGTIRDLVLGVTVVLPDGMRASSGGKVVKNVAGYDLGKLFCGSRGRLGRVERVSLRLHPQPEASATAILPGSRLPELRGSRVTASAVDLVGDELRVLVEGSERSVQAQLGRLAPCGRAGDETWDAVRALQATLPGRERWDGAAAPLIRPGPCVAYTERKREAVWSPLAERVVEALCSPS